MFAADFLEPGRELLQESGRRRILDLDIDPVVVAVLDEVMRYLKSRGGRIAESAIALPAELTGR